MTIKNNSKKTAMSYGFVEEAVCIKNIFFVWRSFNFLKSTKTNLRSGKDVLDQQSIRDASKHTEKVGNVHKKLK